MKRHKVEEHPGHVRGCPGKELCSGCVDLKDGTKLHPPIVRDIVWMKRVNGEGL